MVEHNGAEAHNGRIGDSVATGASRVVACMDRSHK
jgi:hypothetical protein